MKAARAGSCDAPLLTRGWEEKKDKKDDDDGGGGRLGSAFVMNLFNKRKVVVGLGVESTCGDGGGPDDVVDFFMGVLGLIGEASFVTSVAV